MELLVKEKLSVRQACKLVKMPRSVFRYTKVPKDDKVLMDALEALVKKHPSIGFWKCYYRLRRKGYGCNHKRLYRVYKLSKLNIRRKIKRRLPERVKQPLFVPEAINQGMDLSKQSMSSKSGLMPTKGDRDAVMAQGNEYKRLAQVGLPGNAVIVSSADSGERAAGNTVANLELQVTPEGGAAYPVSLSYIIAGTDLGPYAPGSSYSVKIDPENRENVTFG